MKLSLEVTELRDDPHQAAVLGAESVTSLHTLAHLDVDASPTTIAAHLRTVADELDPLRRQEFAPGGVVISGPGLGKHVRRAANPFSRGVFRP